MSQENVEVVRSAFDAWNRGDLDSVLAHLDADVEWEENPDVYPGLDRVYRGHAGFLKRQRDAFDAWEWFRVEDQEFIDAGDYVVAALRLKAKGRHSGIEVEMSVCDCFTFRDEKVVRHRVFTDRDEALKAVGLEE
jgi:ketosteroid isomerase-like protein